MTSAQEKLERAVRAAEIAGASRIIIRPITVVQLFLTRRCDLLTVFDRPRDGAVASYQDRHGKTWHVEVGEHHP